MPCRLQQQLLQVDVAVLQLHHRLLGPVLQPDVRVAELLLLFVRGVQQLHEWLRWCELQRRVPGDVRNLQHHQWGVPDVPQQHVGTVLQ